MKNRQNLPYYQSSRAQADGISCIAGGNQMKTATFDKAWVTHNRKQALATITDTFTTHHPNNNNLHT